MALRFGKHLNFYCEKKRSACNDDCKYCADSFGLMILGIYIFDVRIGSSPFVLTRNEIVGPIFSQPDYLTFIKDGIGLNALLRNYWMVIHPPILFLGFASTIVPIAFAYSSLVTKDWGGWVKPALPWALFSGLCIGNRNYDGWKMGL